MCFGKYIDIHFWPEWDCSKGAIMIGRVLFVLEQILLLSLSRSWVCQSDFHSWVEGEGGCCPSFENYESENQEWQKPCRFCFVWNEKCLSSFEYANCLLRSLSDLSTTLPNCLIQLHSVFVISEVLCCICRLPPIFYYIMNLFVYLFFFLLCWCFEIGSSEGRTVFEFGT